MFSHAVDVATSFTNPFVGLRMRASGEVYSTMGAFIVVNADGWIVTSAHILEDIPAHERGTEVCERDEGPDRVIAHSELWAVPGFMPSQPRIVEMHVDPVADLGLCRIEPFDGESISGYPAFRDTKACPIEQGMSVCRLGFPFCNVPARYNHERGEFMLDERAFPVPRFALDGIVARFNRRFAEDGVSSALYIETSTPGLRGQSGGPLIDTSGRVCGVQSHTSHVDLGFDAQYSTDEGLITERQFLNVGAATHVDEVRSLLDAVGVEYRLG